MKTIVGKEEKDGAQKKTRGKSRGDLGESQGQLI